MSVGIRKTWGRVLAGTRAQSRRDGGRTDGGREEGERRPARKRAHNLFEAAAVYVSGCAENDQDRVDEAAGWVSPEALSFGVNELACRAVIALARERGESPRTVARELLGLPPA
ncbi:hypothetical protein [Streptomyces sp. BK239]|uniref:hypothetical protein n=1 Tax=Streptomyces sp. BK239 TaxID=2512155 RepID=UPI00102D04E4|nr:hypothetical protein [Streptomyces sp. BK239]RZU18100.1 hypothetical protein EV567_3022 [Streptomyces sp. BK239]